MEFIINSPQFKEINERYYERNRQIMREIDEMEKKYEKAYDDLWKQLLKEKEEAERIKELEKVNKDHDAVMWN